MWNNLIDRLTDNPSIMVVFFFAFLLGALFEWCLEHIPYWWDMWRDRRRRKRREREEGPQAFERASERPGGPRPRPPAPQPGPATVVIKGQRDPEPPRKGGRHARPRQRSARFFARSRRQRR